MTDILSSKSITAKNMKLLFWGNTATRKTETILRYFPHVLLIDTEGNARQCIDVSEIPEFLLVQTKDVHEILRIVERVAKGQVRFPDGSLVETLGIDSISVLWSVRQEVGALKAEKRAAYKNKSADEANMTMQDWVIAKRPLKELNSHINTLPVPFLVLTAREKDLYEKKPGGGENELVKVGVAPDMLRGTDYEVNIELHLTRDKGWKATVGKVQGSLGQKLPSGSSYTAFPFEELKRMATAVPAEMGPGEVEVARANLEQEEAEEAPKTLNDLVEWAMVSFNVDKPTIGSALREAGYASFTPGKWEEMAEALKARFALVVV
ncbi:MAG: hypothetical protein M1281_14950 [Chloroflexi bacterium]|nr:hypothetical protein [Chloroflexota bacterium]